MDPLFEINPQKKPNFSPASTAGLIKIILSTFSFNSASTAEATAKYVLPVPAGPPQNLYHFG